MSVVDLPPGEWTPILIGGQWPSSAPLEAALQAAVKRGNLALQFETYGELLALIKSQSLSSQEGNTADDARSDFDSGIATARQIGEINWVKSKSHELAHRSVMYLRTSLGELAAEGNHRIHQSNTSKAPLSEKIAEIREIVIEIRGRALSKVATCAGEISSAISDVLVAQGLDISPQTLAAEHGLTSVAVKPPDNDELSEKISRKIGELTDSTNADGPASSSDLRPIGARLGTLPTTSVGVTDVGTTPTPPHPDIDTSHRPTSTSPGVTDIATNHSAANVGMTAHDPPPNTSVAASDIATNGTADATAPFNSHYETGINAHSQLPIAKTPPTTSFGVGTTEFATAPSSSSPTHTPGFAPSTDITPNTPSVGSAPLAPAAPTPNDLSQTLSTGNQAGAPISALAEAISTTAASPVHTAPPPLNTPVDTFAPVPPVAEVAHAVAPPVHDLTQIAPASTELTQTVLTPAAAGASAAVSPPVSAGPVAMPGPAASGGLIAYGADLRAPAVTAAAAVPTNPAAPGSAPIHPSGGTAATGQPTVLRHQPSAATPLPAAPGLTERAVAATAAGAAAGVTAAHDVAESRLRALLAAVARQQPQLRWAIGDLEDGSTLLVTDLAGGWIPPAIDIPTGVRLLHPGTRHTKLEGLLGAAMRSATYEPGQYLAPAGEPVAMSIRARDTAAVEDLGWELSQATKWRDGLPRLAHTLAKAVSARTGCLDSEVTLLREHLNAVTRSVLAQYPATVSPAEVGNWQLLATIDALLNGDENLANYHFAWFRAQALTRRGQR